MNKYKSICCQLFLCVVGFLVVVLDTAAQLYPTRPIRILVGSAPGGGADFVARILAPKFTDYMGQSITVDNRPGANGALASDLLARAAADGYTIKVNTTGDTINPSLMKLSFDFPKDFSAIALVAESQNMLVVHPSFPVRDIKSLIALSKKNNASIAYGSQGVGSSGHLSGELFQYMTGVKWVHVPYKGGAPALIDLVGGQISLSFGNIPTVIQQVRVGKLIAVAVTGEKRTSAAPEIPTVAEGGVKGFAVSNWFGLSAPARTPSDILHRLYQETARALKSSEVQQGLKNSGAEPAEMSSEQYAQYMQAEFTKWAKVIKAAGIKGE